MREPRSMGERHLTPYKRSKSREKDLPGRCSDNDGIGQLMAHVDTLLSAETTSTSEGSNDWRPKHLTGLWLLHNNRRHIPDVSSVYGSSIYDPVGSQ
jgi:hypothetical protein